MTAQVERLRARLRGQQPPRAPQPPQARGASGDGSGSESGGVAPEQLKAQLAEQQAKVPGQDGQKQLQGAGWKEALATAASAGL